METSGFRYRLETLLDRRAALKEKAQKALADAHKAVVENTERLRRLEQEEVELRERQVEYQCGLLGQGLSDVPTGEKLQRRIDYLRALNTDLQDLKNAVFSQRLKIEDARQAEEAARQTLVDRSRDVEVLEKHRSKLKERFHQEQERLEQIEQDEMGSISHARKVIDGP